MNNFSNFKWENIFQNRNANKCWMKFLEIAKEAIELYVPTRGQKKDKCLLGWQKRYFELGNTKVFYEKIS